MVEYVLADMMHYRLYITDSTALSGFMSLISGANASKSERTHLVSLRACTVFVLVRDRLLPPLYFLHALTQNQNA